MVHPSRRQIQVNMLVSIIRGLLGLVMKEWRRYHLRRRLFQDLFICLALLRMISKKGAFTRTARVTLSIVILVGLRVGNTPQ